MTTDLFPGELALAAFGGATGDWQRGYRWGWEDAAEKANPPPPRGWEDAVEKANPPPPRGWDYVVPNMRAQLLSAESMKGYDAGQAAYERENR